MIPQVTALPEVWRPRRRPQKHNRCRQLQEAWSGGRGHYGNVFSALVAGGGFKGGHVVGSSSARGEEVKERPVYPPDLIGSIYGLLGIDSAAKLPHPQGLAVRATPGAEEGVKTGGILKEIM